MEEALLPVMYELPSMSGVKKCVVTREVIDENASPTLIGKEKGIISL